MIKDTEKFTQDLCNDLLSMPRQVLSIFIDYFSEDRVDLQGLPRDLEKNLEEYSLGRIIPKGSLLISEDLESWETYKNLSIFSLPNEVLTYWLPRLKKGISDLWFDDLDILINFGEVRITNENDRFEDIQGLWAKVKVFTNGTGGSHFKLNRSEYSFLHLRNNYMHSHVGSIPTGDFQQFQIPCLGEGPIIGTITSLCREFDDLRWQLFCVELDNYVHIESLKGGPYHRLEALRNNTSQIDIHDFAMVNTTRYVLERAISSDLIKDFITYFIKQEKLKFNFANGSYGLAMSFLEYMILVSNVFIEWYNIKYNNKDTGVTLGELLSSTILYKCIIVNNAIYINTTTTSDYSTFLGYQGKKVCTFKGQDIFLQLSDIISNTENNSLILNRDIAESILAQTLKLINLKYGKR